MNERPIELRLRAAWVPGGEFRLQLGVAKNKADVKRLEAQRDGLTRLARRGEWDVLRAIKAGSATVEQILAAVDRFGVEDFRAQLPKEQVVGTAPTLAEHVDLWLADCEVSPDIRAGSLLRYRTNIRRLLEFEVNGVPLAERAWFDVPRHTIREARGSLDLAPNTIRAALGCWSSFFQWALEREESEAEHEKREPRIQSNPVRRAKVWSRIEKTRHRFLSRAEFEALFAAAPGPMKAHYATLTLAGLRIDELLTLPPSHVRLPKTIHVGEFGDWKPKAERSTRDIPIHAELLPILEAYAEEYGGHELAFFVNPRTGRPWDHTSFKRRMQIDVVAAGMKYGGWSGKGATLERKSTGVTPHILRHTFGSWLAQQDVQLMKIAALMGDTEETVRTHYVHLLPSDLDAAVSRLNVRLDQGTA